MFRKKKSGIEGGQAAPGVGEPTLKLKGAPSRPEEAAIEKTPKPSRGALRRPVELPVTARRVERSMPAQPEGKKLIVGRDISLNGEITSCEKLVVEGRVHAELTECREIEIARSGFFKGSAEIETADISGRFEGSLTVRDRLLVRASGHVEGDVRYGRLEVESGGRIGGTIGTIEPDPAAAVTDLADRQEAEASG